ncbi:MAG: hemerythrin domain-containing protein [Elusimicrobia bacterium]|nr:hemerythrin domain-containing protein [Elusimicrobiota bacterium]
MTEKPISSYFEADHDRLDLLFQQFQTDKRRDYGKAKNNFRAFIRGLKRHIVWEEDVLFPAFESLSGMPADAGPTEVMRQEHRMIGEVLEVLHDKVRRADPGSDAEEASLLQILGNHNMKEENILYPSIDQLVPPQEAAGLFLAMEMVPEERYNSCCGHSHAHDEQA